MNALGALQSVDDPELLKSAGGCFGLLGIVTAITLRLDAMTLAEWQPKKLNMAKVSKLNSLMFA